MDPAPPSLQDVLDRMQEMESRLTVCLDTKTSLTTVEFDAKLAVVSDELTTKVMDLSNEIEVLSTDIDLKMTTTLRAQVGDGLVSFVDTTLETARVEWRADVNDVASKFRNRISDSESKLDASKILEVLDDTTLEHVRSL